MGANLASPAQALGRALDKTGARTLADWEPHPRVIPEGELAAIAEVCKDISPQAAIWLETYIRTGNQAAAAAIIGISPSTARAWRHRHPPLQALVDGYQEEIRDRWNAVAQHKGMEGFQEWMYNKDGDPAGSRVRQDPGFVRALLGSIDPERWGKDERAQTIVVNVLQSQE